MQSSGQAISLTTERNTKASRQWKSGREAF
jgi:hypothetical protein